MLFSRNLLYKKTVGVTKKEEIPQVVSMTEFELKKKAILHKQFGDLSLSSQRIDDNCK